MINIVKRYSIYFLLLLLIFIFFSRFWLVGFTTNDDVILGNLNAINPNVNHLTNSILFAKNQGRFQYFFAYFLMIAPYLINNTVYFKIISLGSVAVNILLFGYLIRKLFKSETLGLLSATFGLCFIQNSWEHNILVSYPAIFTTSISMLLFSIIIFIKYLDTSNNIYKYFSALLLVLSAFTYEIFILYIIFYVIISIYYANNNIKRSINILLPHLLMVMGYVGLYFGFRLIYKSSYDGNSIFNFSLIPLVKTWYTLSTAFLPTNIFSHYQAIFREFSDSYIANNNIFVIVLNGKIDWYLKSIISSYLAVKLIWSTSVRLSFKKLTLWLLAGGVLIFLPTLLHASLMKYQNWVIVHKTILFTSTYFSYFGIVLCIIVMVIYIKNILTYHRALLLIVMVFIGLSVFFTSMVTDYSNYHISLAQSQNQMVWTVMDMFYKTTVFQQVPEKSYVFAPSLWNNMLIPASGSMMNYWSEYTLYRSKKEVYFLQNIEQLNQIIRENRSNSIFYLNYIQDKKDPNQYLILSSLSSKVIINEDNLVGKGLSIFSLSKYRKYQVLYENVDRMQSVVVNREESDDKLAYTNVDENNIQLNSIVISHQINSYYPSN